MFTIKTKIGNSVLEYQAPDMKTIHKWSSIYGALPPACSECSSKNLHLFHKSPKGNDYFGVRCNDCGAELSFHQLKTGGFFLKQGDRFQKWTGDGETSKPSATKQVDEDGTVPF